MDRNHNRFLHRKKQPFILSYNKKTAVRAAVAMSFILAFVMLSSSILFSSLNDSRSVRFFDFISLRSIVTLLPNALLLYFLFRLQFWAITKYPHNKIKAWAILLSSFVLMAFVSPVITRLQWWWFRGEMSSSVVSTLHYIKDLVILIISFLFTALIYLSNQNQKKITENQNLAMESLQNRYDALKSQIDPHFLFNSLNTLNGLIGFNDKRAHEYVEQLSEVFRYTMQDQKVISLNNELKFAESYIYLMKIRYNDALHVHMRIEPQYRTYKMVPFGLQILIENAIKHNVITRKYPLSIIIETTPDGSVIVENNIQPKHSTTESRGLGLSNLNERYRLMFNKEIIIRPNNTKFIVEIPLIENKDILK